MSNRGDALLISGMAINAIYMSKLIYTDRLTMRDCFNPPCTCWYGYCHIHSVIVSLFSIQFSVYKWMKHECCTDLNHRQSEWWWQCHSEPVSFHLLTNFLSSFLSSYLSRSPYTLCYLLGGPFTRMCVVFSCLLTTITTTDIISEHLLATRIKGKSSYIACVGVSADAKKTHLYKLRHVFSVIVCLWNYIYTY